jgi:1-acyl-sn-glycerol-3-phosphate acyltransferase
MKIFRSFFRLLYKTWCAIWFVLPFLVLYPLYLIFASRPKWYRYAHELNRIWSKLQLRLYGVPLQVERRAKLDSTIRYVFCPNHSSYIDIPMLLSALTGYLNFLGKVSLCKVPLWGAIYKKLYISVDRHSPVSMAKSYLLALKSIDAGRNLVIFPEGTIPETAGSQLIEFKDGPFKLAIEKQIPVVPVTMPFNHIFLPAVPGKFIVNYHPLRLIIHEPIPTTGLTRKDIEPLKNKVFNIIQAELAKHQHDNRYSNPEEISPFIPSRV